jgi:hypothetical protein
LGPALPSADLEPLAVMPSEHQVGSRWGLHAVQEGSSEASSLSAAVRLTSPGALPSGVGGSTTYSGGSGIGESSAQHSMSSYRGRGRPDAAAGAVGSAAGGATAGVSSWLRLSDGDGGELLSERAWRQADGAAAAGAAAAVAAVQGAVALGDLAALARPPAAPQLQHQHPRVAARPPLLSWALWASIQMLLGSVQVRRP